MKKIYVVRFFEGIDIEGQHNFKYCYSSEEQAYKAIEELKKDMSSIEEQFDKKELYSEDFEFWVEELELVD